MLNIEYFYYFVEAAESLSFSSAARTRNISQQGLSRAIRQLENEYGVQLFTRGGATIALTPAGRAFLAEARNIIAAHDSLCDRISIFKPHQKRWTVTVEVLVTLNVAFNVLPLMQEQFSEAFPSVFFSIRELPYSTIVSELCTKPKGLRIGIVSIPAIPQFEDFSPALEYHKIIDMHLMARVGKQSSFAQRGIITQDDLGTHPIIIHDDPALVAILPYLVEEKNLLKKDALVRTDSPSLLETSLLSYDSIGFSNSFVKQYGTDTRFKVIPLEKTIDTPVYVVSNISSDSDGVIETLKSGLIEFVTEDFSKVVPSSTD